jgi:hypothetical protein
LLHLIYCVVWFLFLLIWIQNPFLKWFWKTNIYIRKEKKKRINSPFLLVRPGGLEACATPACPSPSLFWAAEPSSPFPPPALSRVGRPRRRRGHTFLLSCFADGWGPHVSRISHLWFVVELDSNSMESASARSSLA